MTTWAIPERDEPTISGLPALTRWILAVAERQERERAERERAERERDEVGYSVKV